MRCLHGIAATAQGSTAKVAIAATHLEGRIFALYAAARRPQRKLEERWALHRLGPVGRLDKATTGLLLFTDDGGLAKRLVAAGTCRKTYVLDVAGDVTDAALASLARPLDDVTPHTREAVRTAPADVAVLRRDATAVSRRRPTFPSTGRASMA